MKIKSPIFPWQEIMNIGLGKLQLKPEIFWKMTFKEFLTLLTENPKIKEEDFQILYSQFPDVKTKL